MTHPPEGRHVLTMLGDGEVEEEEEEIMKEVASIEA